ncbi:hypothetical protein SAMN05880558_10483 [Aeromonas sp. RU39B]|uniref:hypothetical protein n=1 Tax=Aeromonas sp. RU39B TaxID=1907416 RepID=UPI0009572776|nr:hypothetical protein [Aeromonas sp. RU39B]SIQ57560.1 hypothetical protein SAMN05880558_10483 [Aeromonas sp. RU39B]
MDASELHKKFYKNINSIAESLIELYSLKFKKDAPGLNDPLMRWLDFRLRYVDTHAREITLSNKFPKKDLPCDAQNALLKFCKMIEEGDDINPYQGRGLVLRHDTSGDKRDSRTDLLWADWGIHHFHLSDAPIPQGQYFSKSADYLLFCLISHDVVAFIDVLLHPSKEGFSNKGLIETLVLNWPDYMDRYKLKGILSNGESQCSESEIYELRKSGITPCMTINNEVYMGPGLGLTTASTSVRVGAVRGQVSKFIRGLAVEVTDPKGRFRTKDILQLGEFSDFSIVLTPNGLAVYEANTEHAFLFPRSSPYKIPTLMENIHDLIFPNWARETLLLKLNFM